MIHLAAGGCQTCFLRRNYYEKELDHGTEIVPKEGDCPEGCGDHPGSADGCGGAITALPENVVADTTTEAASAVAVPDSSKGAFASYKKISGIDADTVLGADFTDYQQCLGWGKTYKNYKSDAVSNIFSYVKNQGINTISVKVVVNPSKDTDNYSKDTEHMSLANAEKTLKAANAAGLKTNLVLLYSDEMTYANVQTLPDGWTADTAAAKAEEYTKETLSTLKKDGALPTTVTVGNEVNWNFLGLSSWDGFVAMARIASLLKAEGVRTALSVSCPESADSMKYLLEQLGYAFKQENADYDYLGVNVYLNDGTNALIAQFRDLVAENKKQFTVSSVKCARDDEEHTVNVYTQADTIYNLLSATVSDENVGGLVFDEAAYVGSWNSFFDSDGDAQVSLAIFAYAQGKQVDTSRDPYKYGDETGLKSQKVTVRKVAKMTDSTIRGMDISSYIALENAGVKYYDSEGNEAPLLKILSDNGLNYIRIRIWNDPYNADGDTYGGGANDVEKALEIGRRAKKYGIKVLVDFHYSDFWADPAQQVLPKAWQKDEGDTEKLCEDVYDFTKETLTKFKEEGIDVGMVQVGNEITNGMMGIVINRDTGGNYATIWNDTEKSQTIDKYLNAGSKAVREVLPDALVALHLETPNLDKYKAIMSKWARDNVDYDVLGSSYYPYWSTGQKANTPETLTKVQKYAASQGKLFAVLETGWVNTLDDSDGTPNSIGESADTSAYEVGPQGQVDMLSDLYDTVLSQDNGLGAFYWEGAWIPVKAGWANWSYNQKMADIYGTGWSAKGAVDYSYKSKDAYKADGSWSGNSWDNQTLFDNKGYVLDSLRFYKDAVASDKKQQLTIINICDEQGNILKTDIVKVTVGQTASYTLPSISGYTSSQKQVYIAGTGEKTVRVNIAYEKKQGEQNIKLTKSSYRIPYGSTYAFKKQVSAAGKLTFVSSNAKVIAINKTTGKMTVKKPGKVTITINAAATSNCKAAAKKVTVYAVPKKQAIKKLSKTGRKLRVTVKKDAKASGYQIVTAKDKKFKKSKQVTTSKGAKKVRLTTKKLKTKGTYYVRVRSYKTIDKKKQYGPWSKVKKISVR